MKQSRVLKRFWSWKSQNPAPTGSGVPPLSPRLSTSLSCVEQGEALVNTLLKALKLLGLQHIDTLMGSVVRPLSTQPFPIKALLHWLIMRHSSENHIVFGGKKLNKSKRSAQNQCRNGEDRVSPQTDVSTALPCRTLGRYSQVAPSLPFPICWVSIITCFQASESEAFDKHSANTDTRLLAHHSVCPHQMETNETPN